MMRDRKLWTLVSLGSPAWRVIASACSLFLVACSSKTLTRCNPDVDICGATGDSATTAGGAGGTATSTVAVGAGPSTTTGSTGGSTGGGSGGAGGAPVVDAGRTFKGKIVGYLPTWAGGFSTWAKDLPWLRMSHLNIAFATPSGTTFLLPDGQDPYLGAVVMGGHAAGVKILISIGGANGSAAIANLYTPASVDGFVTNISNYLTAKNLDGIDVDVEGVSVNANYTAFIDKLVTKLRPQGKLVTAALAKWFGNSITPATYAQFDFVNAMAYDYCTEKTAACEHSTYDAAVQELSYFIGKGVASNKLVLGVPFYGYCWGTGCPTNPVPYGQIAVQYPGGMDYIQSGGLTISCNGPATMMRKIQLAHGYGGMMAWQLTQDAGGDKSLLKLIADNL